MPHVESQKKRGLHTMYIMREKFEFFKVVGFFASDTRYMWSCIVFWKVVAIQLAKEVYLCFKE